MGRNKIQPAVILLIGLPGSGKSYYGKILSKDLDISFLDDVHIEVVNNQLLNKQSFIFTTPWLCHPVEYQRIIDKFINAGFAIFSQYWENNLVKCMNNIQYRNDNRLVKQSLKNLAKIYNPPHYSRIIWQSPQ